MCGPTRFRPAYLVLVGVVCLATACSGGTADPGTPPSTDQSTSQNQQTQQNQRNQTAGDFSKAFAQCMRAHGVPRFPDPNGHGGQLALGSGIDPTSGAFQSALNGPCRPLAPPAWVSSGPLSGGGS